MSIVATLSIMQAMAGIASAQTYGNPYELECREELGLIGKELQPGPTKNSLRNCIRTKTFAKRAAKEQARSVRAGTTRQQQILNQVLQEQQNTIPEDGLGSSALRTQFEQECREHLGIGAKEVLHPGPVRGSLERCIERKTSKASRETDATRRRDAVQQKQQELLQQTLKKQQELLQEELDERDVLRRTRLNTQPTINARSLREIAKPTRAQPYYNTKRIDNDATRREDAEQCRGVPAAEWGKCIHDALNPSQE